MVCHFRLKQIKLPHAAGKSRQSNHDDSCVFTETLRMVHRARKSLRLGQGLQL